LGKPSEVANRIVVTSFRKRAAITMGEKNTYFNNFIPSTRNNNRVKSIRAETNTRNPRNENL
jgi:hypothetical protein